MTTVYAVLTATGHDDLVVPISSFRITYRYSIETNIQIVIPGRDLYEQIADRANGSVVVFYGDTPIATKQITYIRIDIGAKKQSITIQANA